MLSYFKRDDFMEDDPSLTKHAASSSGAIRCSILCSEPHTREYFRSLPITWSRIVRSRDQVSCNHAIRDWCGRYVHFARESRHMRHGTRVIGSRDIQVHICGHALRWLSFTHARTLSRFLRTINAFAFKTVNYKWPNGDPCSMPQLAIYKGDRAPFMGTKHSFSWLITLQQFMGGPTYAVHSVRHVKLRLVCWRAGIHSH